MSNTQYSELLEFLLKHFEKIDFRFEKIDQRFDEIDQRFEKIDQRFDKNEASISSLQNTQDFMLGELKEIRQELTIGAHRSRRVENWIIKAAKKINLPYHP